MGSAATSGRMVPLRPRGPRGEDEALPYLGCWWQARNSRRCFLPQRRVLGEPRFLLLMVALGPCSQACLQALGSACSHSTSSRPSPGGDAHPPGQGDHSACHSGLRAGQASGRSPELHQAPVPTGEGWAVVKSECQNWVKTKTAPIRQAAGGGPDPASPGSSPHRLQGRTAVPGSQPGGGMRAACPASGFLMSLSCF